MAIRHMLTAAALSLTLCAVPSVAFAESSNAPPQMPNVENLSTEEANKAISEYNSQVDKYNQAVDEDYNKFFQEVDNYNEEVDKYNAQIDANYEQAVKETEEYNKTVDEHNAAENERVAKEEAENAQAVIDAEVRNKEIEAENAENQARAEQAKENNKAAQEQYEKDLAQYEKDKAQYDKDKAMEDRIIAAGYDSVEQYNDMINKYYNDPADKAVKENTDAKGKEAPFTAVITEATNKSGTLYKVHLSHTYEVNGETIDYRENIFEVDLNDIVTLKSDGAYFIPTAPGYSSFYRYFSDEFLQGYWFSAGSYFGFNTLYTEDGWENGDTHTFSYMNGGKYGVTDDIYMEYYYMWMPLKKYKTYNVPVLPIEPVKKELEDESYELIPYVSPAYREVVPADLWSYKEMPVKGDYLEYIWIDWVIGPDYLEYLPYISEQIIQTNENPTLGTPQINGTVLPTTIPGIIGTDDAANNVNTNNAVGGNPAIAVRPTPQTENIQDETTPLAEGSKPVQNWALLNLIFMIINIILLVFVPRRRKEDEEKDYEYKHHNNIVGVILAVIAVIAFILTENVFLPMVFVDQWTWLMGILCGGGIVARFFSRTTKEEKE